MSSKYERLGVYLLAAHHHGMNQVAMTFGQLETILGERLPDGAQIRRSWWSTFAATRAANGWQVRPDLQTGTISFVRRQTHYT